MALEIKQAKRELVFTKIALLGPSGSGKTYSALKLATGMAKELEPILKRTPKILMLNTESSRGLYYADEFTYDIADIQAPHYPEKYADSIDEAVKSGYDILIMDSTSHEWEGRGGCLNLQQLAGGTYQAWAKVTPRHDAFILSIADSPIHIIATMRGKDQYEMEKSDDGKINVKKLGVGAIQRNNFEYEFTLTFLLDQIDNHAVAQKDNTHLFEHEGRILLKEDHGKQLIKWANSGEGYTPRVKKNNDESEAQLSTEGAKTKDLRTQIKTLYTNNPDMQEKFKSLFDEIGNPNDTKDIAVLKLVLEGMTKIKNGE